MDNTKKLMFSIDKFVVPQPIEKDIRGKDYITWGEDNLYPQYLYDLYTNSATHQSICKGVAEYIYGQGVESTYDVNKIINNDDETLSDVIKKAIDDYVIFGGFCLQVIYSEDMSSIVEIYNLEMENVRYGTTEDTDTGIETEYIYYSEKWGKWGEKAIQIPVLKRDNKYGSKAFYYKSNSRTKYPVPSYVGAIRDIETSIKISDFHLNAINNNFNASAIISFNDGDIKQEVKDQLVEDLIDTYTGSENAAAVICTFNKSKDNAPEISRLQSDDFDKKYEQLSKSVQQNIFTAHRITSPALFGVKMENTGFSSVEFEEAFTIFQSTVIDYAQSEIEKAFKKLLNISVTFKKFTLNNGTTNQPTIEGTPDNNTELPVSE